MKDQTRIQELADFFAEHALFMPPTIDAREAIHFFVHKGNIYGVGGSTPPERIAALKKVTEDWKDQLVMIKTFSGQEIIVRVQYVLPKTQTELERERYVKSSFGEKLEMKQINPFKVCVGARSLRRRKLIDLDLLQTVSG